MVISGIRGLLNSTVQGLEKARLYTGLAAAAAITAIAACTPAGAAQITTPPENIPNVPIIQQPTTSTTRTIDEIFGQPTNTPTTTPTPYNPQEVEPTPAYTPEPTNTPSPTPVPPTPTWTPTRTPTNTPSPTATATPANTPAYTGTPATTLLLTPTIEPPTATPYKSPTPTATANTTTTILINPTIEAPTTIPPTATATATSTPEPTLEAKINELFGPAMRDVDFKNYLSQLSDYKQLRTHVPGEVPDTLTELAKRAEADLDLSRKAVVASAVLGYDSKVAIDLFDMIQEYRKDNDGKDGPVGEVPVQALIHMAKYITTPGQIELRDGTLVDRVEHIKSSKNARITLNAGAHIKAWYLTPEELLYAWVLNVAPDPQYSLKPFVLDDKVTFASTEAGLGSAQHKDLNDERLKYLYEVAVIPNKNNTLSKAEKLAEGKLSDLKYYTYTVKPGSINWLAVAREEIDRLMLKEDIIKELDNESRAYVENTGDLHLAVIREISRKDSLYESSKSMDSGALRGLGRTDARYNQLIFPLVEDEDMVFVMTMDRLGIDLYSDKSRYNGDFSLKLESALLIHVRPEAAHPQGNVYGVYTYKTADAGKTQGHGEPYLDIPYPVPWHELSVIENPNRQILEVENAQKDPRYLASTPRQTFAIFYAFDATRFGIGQNPHIKIFDNRIYIPDQLLEQYGIDPAEVKAKLGSRILENKIEKPAFTFSQTAQTKLDAARARVASFDPAYQREKRYSA